MVETLPYGVMSNGIEWWRIYEKEIEDPKYPWEARLKNQTDFLQLKILLLYILNTPDKPTSVAQ